MITSRFLFFTSLLVFSRFSHGLKGFKMLWSSMLLSWFCRLELRFYLGSRPRLNRWHTANAFSAPLPHSGYITFQNKANPKAKGAVPVDPVAVGALFNCLLALLWLVHPWVFKSTEYFGGNCGIQPTLSSLTIWLPSRACSDPFCLITSHVLFNLLHQSAYIFWLVLFQNSPAENAPSPFEKCQST